MTELATLDAYAVLTEPTTLKIQRLLPGPIERVWAYLTESDKRRQWLAAGKMEMKVGAPFEFVWRNDELNNPPSQRPEGFPEQHSMQSRITEIDPPRKLAFTWQGSGDVSFELNPNTRCLTHGGTRVPLSYPHFGVLEELVLRAPDVVPRKRLSIAGWGSDVNENSIEQAVSQLRKALGQNGQVKHIDTVSGRGYRMAVAVQRVEALKRSVSAHPNLVRHCEAIHAAVSR